MLKIQIKIIYCHIVEMIKLQNKMYDLIDQFLKTKASNWINLKIKFKYYQELNLDKIINLNRIIKVQILFFNIKIMIKISLKWHNHNIVIIQI